MIGPDWPQATEGEKAEVTSTGVEAGQISATSPLKLTTTTTHTEPTSFIYIYDRLVAKPN